MIFSIITFVLTGYLLKSTEYCFKAGGGMWSFMPLVFAVLFYIAGVYSLPFMGY